MAVGLQVRATRTADTLPGSVRLLRLSGWAIAGACVCAYAAGRVDPLGAALLMTVAIAVNTGAELWSSAASWYRLAELTPAGARGAYSGVWRLGSQAQAIAGPAGITWLVMSWRPEGWFVLAGLLVGSSLLVRPVVRWAPAHRGGPRA